MFVEAHPVTEMIDFPLTVEWNYRIVANPLVDYTAAIIKDCFFLICRAW
jgi:hypothetical protein